MGLAIIFLVAFPFFLLIGLVAFWTHRHFKRVDKPALSLLLPGLIILIGVGLAALVAGSIADYLARTLTRGV